jgi:hypothetical protein
MKSLNNWIEFGVTDAPSIKETFLPEPYKEKNDVLKYLKKGKTVLAATEAGIDYFTNKEVDSKHYIMTDGEYSWDSMLIYYVEKYNAKPDQEFIAKALKG